MDAEPAVSGTSRGGNRHPRSFAPTPAPAYSARQDERFAELSGARVVRIATHPDATRLGYGARALDLLRRYYEGQLMSAAEGSDEDEADDEEGGAAGGVERSRRRGAAAEEEGDGSLATERVRPRKQLPPLLVNVADVRRPERVRAPLPRATRPRGVRCTRPAAPPPRARRSTGSASLTASRSRSSTSGAAQASCRRTSARRRMS